jgi:hypothetical protein
MKYKQERREYMDKGKVIPPGGTYVGIKGGGDAGTNQILYEVLGKVGLSADPDPVRKEYQGKPIDVWPIPTNYIRMLYAREKEFKLNIEVYIENSSYKMRIYHFLEPTMRIKAKKGCPEVVKKMKKKIQEKKRSG